MHKDRLRASSSAFARSARIPIWRRALAGKHRISILAGSLWFFLGPIRGLDASRMAFWFFGNLRGTGTPWLIQLSHFRLSSFGLFLVSGPSLRLLFVDSCFL